MNRTAIVLVAGLAAACGNSSIAEGRGRGMPSWGTKINEDDVWKLVSYIKTLRTRDEIQPPEPQ